MSEILSDFCAMHRFTKNILFSDKSNLHIGDLQNIPFVISFVILVIGDNLYKEQRQQRGKKRMMRHKDKRCFLFKILKELDVFYFVITRYMIDSPLKRGNAIGLPGSARRTKFNCD